MLRLSAESRAGADVDVDVDVDQRTAVHRLYLLGRFAWPAGTILARAVPTTGARKVDRSLPVVWQGVARTGNRNACNPLSGLISRRRRRVRRPGDPSASPQRTPTAPQG